MQSVFYFVCSLGVLSYMTILNIYTLLGVLASGIVGNILNKELNK